MTANRGQYKKGKSGNPKGRPPKINKLEEGKSILDSEILVGMGDESTEVDPITAVLLAVRSQALEGNSVAAKLLHKFAGKFEPHMMEGLQITEIIVQIIAIPADIVLFDLGVYEDIDGSLKVSPWVVEEALKRDPRPNVASLDREKLLAAVANERSAERLLSAFGLESEVRQFGTDFAGNR